MCPVGNMCSMDERAASTQVGMLLVTAMIVVSVSVPAAFVLGGIADRSSNPPLVDVDGDVTTESVILTNAGGEAVALDSLSVVVVADGTSTRLTPSASRTLAPSDSWRHAVDANLSAGDRVTVVVTHRPTDGVVFEGAVTVQEPPTDNEPSTVTASAADASVTGAERTQLTASASDPDGDDLSYEWRLVAGGSVATLENTTGEAVGLSTRTVEEDQTVVAEVTVSDGTSTASADVTVTVTPSGDAGPGVVSLSAAGSGDGELGVRLTVNESLSSLRVSVAPSDDGDGEAAGRVLTLREFSETETDDGVTYATTVSGLADGTYVATVEGGADEAGNDLPAGASATGRVASNESPEIGAFEATDGPGNSKTRVTVALSDSDGWGDAAEARISVVDDGETVDSTTVRLDESPTRIETSLRAPKSKGESESYEAHLVVTDGDGARATDSETVITWQKPPWGPPWGPPRQRANLAAPE